MSATSHGSSGRSSAIRRGALGVGGALLLGLNAVWLLAASHQDQALAAIQARDGGTALEQYQAAVALTPLDAELRVDQARVEAETGDLAAAERSLRQAAALAPTWGRPHYRLGRLLESQGRLDQAAAEYEKAAALDPRATPPLVALAAVREAQGRHPEALNVDRRIVGLEQTVGALDEWTDPNPAIAHEAMGREAEARGDRAVAIREYRAGAERLRRWRHELPYREQIRGAIGEGADERQLDLLRLEVRLWQRLASLYGQTGQPAAAAEAQQEAAAAQGAASKVAGGGAPG